MAFYRSMSIYVPLRGAEMGVGVSVGVWARVTGGEGVGLLLPLVGAPDGPL